MIEFLNRIAAEGILLELTDGKLKLFAEKEEIDRTLLGEIKDRKEELLDYLRREEEPEADLAPMPLLAQQSHYPISYSQRRLWVLSQFEQGSLAYHLVNTAELTGRYRLHLIRKAVGQIIDRHEILRTTFERRDDGQIVQIVHESVGFPFKLEFQDVRNQAEAQSQINAYIAEDYALPFDLVHGPLLRACVFQLADDRYLFYFNMHHLISDAWSMNVLMGEVLEAYQALEEGRPSRLAPLRVQYKEYASWLRSQWETTEESEAAAFWKEQLSGELPSLELPMQKKRPKVKTYNGHNLGMYLTEAESRQLKEFGHRQGGSLYMTLLAIWQILLYRLSGQNDILIGSPTAGRDHPDLQSQIGCYVNTLVMRQKLEADDNFDQLYAKVKQNTQKAFSHQMYPFDLLVDQLTLKRDTSRSVLFDLMLSLQNTSDGVEAPDLPSLAFEEIEDLGQLFVKFDLEIVFEEIGPYLSFSILYNTDLFAAEDIEGLMRRFRLLAGRLTAQPAQAIGRVSLMSEEEAAQVQQFSQGPCIHYPANETVLDLYQQQWTQHPEAIAISYETEQLTYAQLEGISNQWRAFLEDRFALQADQLVAVRLDRSQWLVPLLLGVLKAGAAYIPLDTDYPEQRMEQIQADSQFQICVDEQLLAEFIQCRNEYSKQMRPSTVKAGQLAYVIYTSGSTGLPKGVQNEHGGLYNRLLWMRDQLEIHSKDVLLQKTPYTFDVSVWELLLPLATGSRLVMARPEGHKDPTYLQQLIQTEKVSIIHFVPSMLGAFLFDLEADSCQSLRHMVCSGEALPDAMVQQVQQILPWLRIHNYYGPTEAAIDVTAIDLTEVNLQESIVTIGRPVANTQIWILSDKMELQPIGVPGELMIGGCQLARGYVNRPQLNQEKFTDQTNGRGRLYRSGDLAKWLPNGQIAYIGRIDNQVKIRGNRIELGEVENALQQFPQALQAAVVVREDQAGNKKLIGFLQASTEFSEAECFAFLKEKLPEYMLPSLLITLDAMPLTRSGKVDRKALPQTTAALSGQREYIAPTNEMQNTLVRIWQEVLGLEKVGISDSFFQIGGDSILLLNVLSRMKKEMGYELNIGLLYELDTIAALCDHLETASHLHQDRQMWREQAEAWLENVRMAAFEQWPDAAELEDAYPMTDIQKGMVMYSLLQGQQATYHEQFVYEIPRVEVRLFAKAMRRMVKKHAIFRTSFHLSGFEEPMQLVHKSVQVAIDQRDLRHLDQEEQVEQINAYVASERQRPFSSEEGLLWRIALFAISDDKAVMLFQFHHAILDGWSVAAFNTELFQTYLALERDPHFQLAPIRASYRDAVVEEWMEKQHSESRDFWAEKLANYSRLDLFGDGIESKELQKTYEPAYLDRLRRRCEAEGIELRTLFLGAFALSLNVLTYEKDDFVIGLVSHNRPIVEDSDQLLGCFLNTLPVKVPLEEWEGKTFANYFQGVEKELKEVRRHSRLTLPEIVRSVGGDAGENNPFFDVLFNYVDFHVYDGIDSDSATGDQLRNDSEEQTMNFSSHDVTNTYLDLNVSVTAGYLTFGYNQEKTLRLGIELEAIHQRVERLLECFVERGAEQMAMADFVGAEERHQLLQEFNNTAFDHLENLTVVDLFYQQCDRSPDAVALVFGDEQMTYAQVDAYSNQLAHYLQAWCRPQADERIAVLLERGLRMPIALLGILKSGAAYVPLDVRHPQERIDYIASDSACRMVINAMEWAHFEKQRSQFSTDRPDLRPAPGQLAYVLYTSGTTGRPKGVAVEHRSVNNLLHWFADAYRIDEQTRAIQLTDISFDPSVEDLFGTLIKGGSYHIISRELLLDMPALRQYIEERRISILNCVPNVLHQLLVGYTKLKFTQIIISGGEKLPKNTKNQLLQLGYELYNNYGPTEATVDALSGKVGDGAVTIGRPIANAKAYVLGKDLQLLPKGSIGRLYLSGAGLAREYLGREELTRQRFVENPFAKGERMYDTGDLAHWTAEGEMVFLGRMDRQLKIRGHRIEPGEIEKQLTACDGVEAAAVQALEQRGNAFLVAYYTASADVSEESLRQQLAQQLPSYMLPNSFVALTEMPRTANGKIDYRALPAPGEQEQDQFVAPDNEMETKLQAICAETLELEPQHISMHQSFFGLGGHSLKVIELLAAIRKQMGKELAMAEVFAGRSLRQLAQELAQSGAFSTEDELLSLLRQENAEAPHLFFVHDGTGDVQGYVQLCQALKGFNCWGLRSDTLLQVAPQTMSIEDIASRCIQRMQLLQPSGNYRVLGWSTGGLVAMEITHQLEAAGQEVEQLILFDSLLPDPENEEAWPEFSIAETEVPLLEDLLGSDQLQFDVQLSLPEFWEAVLQQLQQMPIDREALLELIPDIISNAQQLSLRELITYVNAIRSLEKAHRDYWPDYQLKASVQYLKATQSTTQPEDFAPYFSQPVQVQTVEGDHTSIMKQAKLVEHLQAFLTQQKLVSTTN